MLSEAGAGEGLAGGAAPERGTVGQGGDQERVRLAVGDREPGQQCARLVGGRVVFGERQKRQHRLDGPRRLADRENAQDRRRHAAGYVVVADRREAALGAACRFEVGVGDGRAEQFTDGRAALDERGAGRFALFVNLRAELANQLDNVGPFCLGQDALAEEGEQRRAIGVYSGPAQNLFVGRRRRFAFLAGADHASGQHQQQQRPAHARFPPGLAISG